MNDEQTEYGKAEPGKGSATLGMAGGLVVGGFTYMLTHQFGTAFLYCVLTSIVLSLLLRFISKYFLFFAVAAFILYSYLK